MKLQHWTFWILLLLGHTVAAQKPAPQQDVQRINIIHANTLQYLRQGENQVQKLIGDVELNQDSIFMYCDSAYLENSILLFAMGKEVLIQQGDSLAAFADTLYYNGTLKEADLIKNVVLVSGTRKLFTEKLHYDLNTKIATYETPAIITDGETQLSSKRGYYYTQEEDIYFKDSVIVINPQFQLRADTLKFNTVSQIATFLGPTVMRSDSTQVYCEAGFYDVGNQVAEFRENAQYRRGAQTATADIIRYDGANGVYTLDGNAVFKEGTKREATGDLIRYDEKNDVTTLEGNAYFRDSSQIIRGEAIRYDAKRRVYKTTGRSRIEDGAKVLQANDVDYNEENNLGTASGNVIWQDTSANLTITCDTAVYNQTSGYLRATGGLRGRPMLLTVLDSDTLYMTADTLLSLQPDTVAADSNRLLLAFRDVRIFKSNLQALADSLAYSTSDSLFRMFYSPIIWTDTTQFTADTVHLALADNKLDKIYLYNNSFILNSADLKYFNQIKGRDVVVHFDSSRVDKMDVLGNAQSVYYALDDEGAYVGVNKTICSDMYFYFENNEIREIAFVTQLEGDLQPMDKADHEAIKLEGFDWRGSPPRPQSVDDLFGPAPREGVRKAARAAASERPGRGGVPSEGE